ncbi:CCDC66 domain-containing protein [Trichonephila clavata]|uniref:CCDC66 domain-containing protein n=1 Tax=Trichonephila clavata TaxID=2740835 RepID=A0A8X6F3X8_TRICU|nr:CCDC66 domain-containing protein [Trichonephila clavata]
MVRPPGGESRQLPIAEVKPDSWDHGSPEKSPKNDTVTLTKSQFQQILEAIGQSTVLNGSDKIFTCHDNPEYFPIENNPETVHESEIENEAKQNGNSDLTTTAKESCNQLKVPCPLDVVISCPASLSWSAPQTVVSPSKLSPLSKIEQKRLQWEKERAEMIDWNPWGKPGAGAPAKKTQVVAPITSRTNNQLLMVQTSGAMPYTNSVPSAIPSCLPSPNCRILPNTLDHSTFLPNNYTSVAQSVKPVPPVFKSSIAFGNTENELVSSDSFKREQWLRELDFQREEQRRYQEQIQMSQMAESHWINKEDTESISVSVDGSIAPGASDMHRRSYMRGQGFILDPVSAALAEERRMKAQEYQQAIRMQMEEKQRRQQAERERKKQEEEAEEKRLEADRARMQAEYEEEQLRLKQKAEMEEKKHQALISAVQQAQVQAEMEKKSRKIQKLLPVQPGNQETSAKKSDQIESLSNCMESQLKMDNNIESNKMEQSNVSSQQNNKNKENSSLVESDCEPIDKKELGVQTMPVSDSEKSSVYVVDRVLTPSIFRVRERAGCAREFGTQTDIHYGKYTREDAESTESNTSSFHSPVAKRIVRVQHSKPYKAQRRPQCIENAPAGERPKWGVNQPSKSYVRMTERDPHFSKRKKMQELRKQHWARELAAQKANESSRKSILSSYPSLRGRRAASSSDCTLGYSSSEFETRSYRQIRSNSTPRYQQPSGFRSDCGSAETIAYFNYSPPSHNNRFSRSFLHRRDSQSSDNLPSIIGGSEPSPSRHIDRYAAPSCGGSSLPPMRRKWHSQETFHPSANYHIFSPPHVPGVYPRTLVEQFRYELPPPLTTQRRKWSDQESFDLESVVRSKVAEGSRASSAESSEKSESASLSSAGSSKIKSPVAQNPLVCPEVVTGRPTPRQDRILQNLSSLRQGLIKKQKELENLIRRPPPYYS